MPTTASPQNAELLCPRKSNVDGSLPQLAIVDSDAGNVIVKL